jgi:hypothetical protein
VFPSPFISTSFFSFMFISVSLLSSAYTICDVAMTPVSKFAVNTAIAITILLCVHYFIAAVYYYLGIKKDF